ncbi:MAG: c-type cytochrome biogenesis protein CcmI [Salinarimonadaceae bacterium]|nr:MAG: c-type cytochrome biogenesis protein CcmI [Salinarimonadaceae bacterium]
MAIWIILAAMTAAAVMSALWPLSRARTAALGTAGEGLFYRDQIEEIDRELARGLFSPAEAAAAKAEAARRLIRAESRRETAGPSLDEPALRRRRAASAVALSAVPLLALAIYGAYGSPHEPAQPLAARLVQERDLADMDISEAVARIESHLQQNPADGRGWEVLAPVYMRQGRFDAAANAYAQAIRHLGEEPNRLANYGEALVNASEGVVQAAAREAFEAAVATDPLQPKARYYLGRAAEQDGDPEAALRRYEALLRDSPSDAPWISVVRARIDALGAASQPASPALGIDAIEGMVAQLAGRLAEGGGSAEDWARLVRSYMVLDRAEQAAGALAEARRALANDPAGLAEVEETARHAGVGGESGQ